jgi:cytochrome c
MKIGRRARRSAVVLAALLACAAALAVWQFSRSAQRVAVAQAMTGGEPARAPTLLRRYGCVGCHTIPGIAGADGKVGPPLADLRGRVFIAGAVKNTPENLLAWIVDPQRLAPGSAMPASGISVAEARDVAAYLYTR